MEPRTHKATVVEERISPASVIDRGITTANTTSGLRKLDSQLSATRRLRCARSRTSPQTRRPAEAPNRRLRREQTPHAPTNWVPHATLTRARSTSPWPPSHALPVSRQPSNSAPAVRRVDPRGRCCSIARGQEGRHSFASNSPCVPTPGEKFTYRDGKSRHS